jgi:hypothetical protein
MWKMYDTGRVECGYNFMVKENLKILGQQTAADGCIFIVRQDPKISH